MSEGLIDIGQIPGNLQAFATSRLGMVYLTGVGLSITGYAALRGVQSYTEWDRARIAKLKAAKAVARNRSGELPDDKEIEEPGFEEELSAVVSGIGWGVWRGLGRGWFWPIEFAAGAIVLGLNLKRRRDRKAKIATMKEEGEGK